MKSIESRDIVLILHDIRSSQNVGSMFRSADAVGVTQIYLSGITPTPVDKFNKPNTPLTKASLGAENTVSWKKISTISPLIKKLQEKNYTLIAIEQSQRAVDYKHIQVSGNVAFIMGNEVDGVPESVLSKMTHIAQIPMKGKKESLNVSVACGIALYRILNV